MNKTALMIIVLMTGTIAFSQNPDNLTIIKPNEINDVLINPGIGFNTFQMFNGDNLAPNQDVLREADIEQFMHAGKGIKNNNYP